eukprot:TRINITY_DN83367_c0_g1_i1.p1 TRINITY_DN83367_c0_g1~~TRINITY_DN83367_c0_g1_i1.p1  ORF type:complete len:148 (+),score=8.72 TRINITY_DN83367_c0_g1_i1:186-629(+)
MSEPQTFTPEPLSITDNALIKVKTLIEEEGNDELKFRVYVTGGGCSGFQYGFAFDESFAEDDAQVEKDGITVLIDAMSYPYLVGAQLDYEEGLQGAKFKIENPNASSTCGCGSSFSIQEHSLLNRLVLSTSLDEDTTKSRKLKQVNK